MTHEEQLIRYAQQGNPEAIAALLNYYFEPQQISVKVGWQENQLVLLCEGLQLKSPESLTATFEKILGNLKIRKSGCDSIKGVLCGRILGEAEPTWQVPLQISALSLTPPHPSILDTGTGETSEENLPESLSSQLLVSTMDRGHGDREYGRFLCCGIEGSTQAIAQKLFVPAEAIDGVVQIFSSLILPVPYMPPSILGIVQHRGQLVWIVDLLRPYHDGLQPKCEGNHRYITLMLNSSNQDSLIGFVVPRVEPQQVHSMEINASRRPQFQHLPDMLVPFLADVVTSDGSPILNPNALFQDSHLQIHQGSH